MAKITLMGLNNYDGHLFDSLKVPSGINKETLVNNILIKSGDYEVLYPDITFCKQAIAVWSSKWQRTMERWVAAIESDWNPIENYDRYEEWSDDGKNSNTIKGNTTTSTLETSTGENHSSGSGTDSNTSSGSGTNTATRSAYDSSVYEPDNKAESSTTGTSSTTTSNSNEGSSSNETIGSVDSAEESTNNGTTSSKHTGHVHGNIGVTTSSAMYLEYQEAMKWNVYEQITDLFLTEFVIPIL